MKATLGFVLLAVGFAGGYFQSIASAADERLVSTPRWEYRVLTKEQVLERGKKDLAAGLNALGEEGWELAAVDGVYVFKRSKDANKNQREDVKSLISLIEADVESLRDRAAWAERMFKKGFYSNQQLQAEKLQLQKAEMALDKARRELKALQPDPKEAAEKDRKPEK
jgi:hypothetical protein